MTKQTERLIAEMELEKKERTSERARKKKGGQYPYQLRDVR